MGTRADFYVQRDDGLDWLGSIGWDGYPDGIAAAVLAAETEDAFVAALTEFAAKRDDWTAPERGWPWPWDDSGITDYAYVFVPGVGVVHMDDEDDVPVYVRSIKLLQPEPEWVWDDYYGHTRNAAVEGVSYAYPDMSGRKRVTLGARSGVMIIGGQS